MNTLKKSASLFLLFFLISCNTNRWEIETTKINLTLETYRFELDLFASSTDGLSKEEFEELKTRHKNFFALFTDGIMSFNTSNEFGIMNELNNFTHNEDILSLFQDVKEAFPENNLTSLWSQLENAFKRYHYYFPQRIVPKIYTMIAAFNYSTVVADSVLAIGLEMYMGADYELYPILGIPKYKFENFTTNYILPDAMNAWLLTEFDREGSQNLLEQMVYRGKIAYLAKIFLPEVEFAYLFNYDKNDLKWCEENESEIWFHFIDMELLFTTESRRIRKYMGDAPFIAEFPKGSPGRVGHWVGYKIVEAFMENNPTIGLDELMQSTDANRILRKSKYKPSR